MVSFLRRTLNDLLSGSKAPNERFKGLWDERDACEASVGPETYDRYRNIFNCVWAKVDEIDKARLASFQYVFTLWPALVVLIVYMGPDPYYMVYDDILWSILFAITSAGMPGQSSALPPHHTDVLTVEEGRQKCEAWVPDPTKPRKLAKSGAVVLTDKARHWHIFFERFSFWLCVTFVLIFIALFTWAVLDGMPIMMDFPLDSVVWYYIAGGPALMAALFEVWLNRVELYEPVVRPVAAQPNAAVANQRGAIQLPVHANAPKQNSTTTVTISNVTGSSTNNQFRQVTKRSALSIWCRIACLQYQRQPYRILVKPRELGFVNMIASLLIVFSRLAVFCLGSAWIANTFLMYELLYWVILMVLIFATGFPRFLWKEIWPSCANGADLVVWVHLAGTYNDP